MIQSKPNVIKKAKLKQALQATKRSEHIKTLIMVERSRDPRRHGERSRTTHHATTT